MPRKKLFFTLIYEHRHPVNTGYIQSYVYILLLSRTVCNIAPLMLSCLLSLTTVVFVDAQSSRNKDTIFPSDRCVYPAEVAFLVKRA